MSLNEGTDYKGLANIGATCYMNSLLQTLFMTQEFRNEIYKWKYDELIHGKKQDSILYQLQKLFAKLETKYPGEIDTRELVQSFQWGSDEIIQQQDIQQFNRVLFEAIQISLKITKEKQNQFLNELYEGIMMNYTKCKICDTEYPRNQTFQDLVINIKNKFEKVYNDSVELGLQRYIKPELLQGANLYNCESCQTKVVAQRGVKFIKIPKLLSIILQRFTFDYNIMSKLKINDQVRFPWILNMNDYMNGYQGIKNKLSQDKTQHFKDEEPVVVKKKPPLVINKNSFTKKQTKLPNNIKNKPAPQTKSFLQQMRKKTGKNKEVTIEIAVGERFQNNTELETQLAVQQSLITHKNEIQLQKKQSLELPPPPPPPLLNQPQILTGLPNEPPKLQLQQKMSQSSDNTTKRKNGEVTQEMREQFDKNLKQFEQKNNQLKQKYLLEGELVYQLYSILIHNGGPNFGHYFAYIKSFENGRWYCFNDYKVTELNIKDIEKQVFGGKASSNAYGLYYRIVQKQKMQRQNIPEYIKTLLNIETQNLDKKQKQRQLIEDKYIKLKIYYQLYARSLEIPNNVSLKVCLEQAKILIGNEHFTNIKPQNIRIRMFNPAMQTKLDTFTGRQQLSLAELKINSHKSMLIEVKKDDEVFDQYVVGLSTIRIVEWEPNIQSLEQNYLKTQKLTLPKTFIMKEIQKKICEKLNLEKIAIMKRHQNDQYSYHEIINTFNNDYYSKTLEQIPVFENQIVFIEKQSEDLNWPKEFESQVYRVTLRYTLPTKQQRTTNYETIVFDSRLKLAQLKDCLCKKHNLDPDFLIIKRSSRTGLELKNLNESLKEYRFITGTQIYLEEGLPAQPGQTRIILYLSMPTELNHLTCFHTFDQVCEIPINGNIKASECKQLFLKVLKKVRNIEFDINRIRIRQKLSERMTKIYREKPMREQQLIQKRTIAIQQIFNQEILDIKQNVVYIKVFDPQNWQLGDRFEIVINKNTTMHDMAEIIYSKTQVIPIESMQICKITALYKFSLLDLAEVDYYQMIGIDLPVISEPLFINNDGLLFIIRDRNKQLRELTREQEKALGGTIRPLKPIKTTYKPPKKEKGVVITVKKGPEAITENPKTQSTNQLDTKNE